MAISAQEAGTIRFEEDRRGYATTQVEAFRERVVNALRFYEAELAKFRERSEQADQRITELEEAEEAVKRTFLAAARTKKDMLAEAESEAESVRADAQRDADETVAAANSEAAATRRSAAEEAKSLLDETKVRAAAAESELSAERKRLEARLAQLRGAVRDIDERLRRFAEGALENVTVVGDMIDLETTRLEDIPAFQQPALESAPAGERSSEEG